MMPPKPSLLRNAVCLSVRSGIVPVLYFSVFLAAFELAAILPQPWSAVGIAFLLSVAGSSFCGKWPARHSRLESLGLGYQPHDRRTKHPANTPLSPGARASLALLRFRRVAA